MPTGRQIPLQTRDGLRHLEPRAAPEAPNTRPERLTLCHCSPEDHFGRRGRRDLLISAVHTHAQCTHTQRRLAIPLPTVRRLEPAAHWLHLSPHTLHTRALCSADRALQNSPEKPASPTGPDKRNRWSGACTPARSACLTSSRGGGGHQPTHDRWVHDPMKALVGRSCICSCIRTRPLSSGRRGDRSRETQPWPRHAREPLTAHVE
jgi:hypothetical protein